MQIMSNKRLNGINVYYHDSGCERHRELLLGNANYTFLCKFMALFNTGGSSLDIVNISEYTSM